MAIVANPPATTALIGFGTHVKDFGAIGDGTADDTLAIRAAITAAGVNGTLVFQPNKTYLISGNLQLLAGQTLLGAGATLKRRTQISTTTTTSITSGVTTSITVTSAAGMTVGMGLVFADSATTQVNLVAGTTLSSTISQITAIVGNVLTVSPAPTATLSSGAKVFLSFYSLVLADDVHVSDLTFDGNRSNWTWGRWEVTNEIFTGTSTSRCLVRGCHFTNAPGEGIVVNGSYHRVRDCHLLNLSGNGIHFSGATHPVVDSCSVVNCNLDVNVAHSMGCVGWSNTIDDATVTNCFLQNGRAGIGSIDDVSNSNVTVANNTIRSCTTYGIEVGSTAADLTITGNRIYSCGSGANGGLSVLSSSGLGITISHNLWVSCSVQLNTATNVLFLSNTIQSGNLRLSVTNCKIRNTMITAGQIFIDVLTTSEIVGNTVDLTGDTTTTCIFFNGTGGIGSSIRNNTLIAGVTGIGSSYTGHTDLIVAENECRGNYAQGIIFSASGSIPGLMIVHNHCTTMTSNASSWIGMRIKPSTVTVRNNQISNVNGSGRANYGIYLETGTNNVVADNTVRGAYNIATIGIIATSTSAIVQGNYVSTAISDLGTTTTLANNTVTG